MDRRQFEAVRPEALAVGDVVEGNGALWRIVSFGRWSPPRTDGGRCEYVYVECVDPRGVHPFFRGYNKQFALYPESGRGQRKHVHGGGNWSRVIAKKEAK